MSGIVFKVAKGLGFLIAGLIGLLLILFILIFGRFQVASWSNLASLGPSAPELNVDGFAFRDLNKNDQLDVYEDRRASVEARVDDLLGQMTLEEKAGLMFINFTPVGAKGNLVEIPSLNDPTTLIFAKNSDLIAHRQMNHFSLISPVDDPGTFISWHNKMQGLAERTRLGIPVTLASDPRHGVKGAGSISLPAGAFSKWPEPLGLAAIGNADLVEEFADIARQEYRAVGIHVALHPVADLATEPRWSRISGTFGEDANLSARMVGAYVRGMQGAALGPGSVATMVKHFSGGGPQMDGEDAHFPYGKEQVYPGDNFDYHLIPFIDGAFPAGAAQIMPYYGIPMGQTSEDVGFAFNKEIITDLLRNQHGFDGVVCSDWGLITDAKILGTIGIMEARAWGVEDLSHEERMLKMIDAGIDQFGGENIPAMLVKLVRDGSVEEARLDVSVRRLLRDKFRLGLFDAPYTDLEQANAIVGRDDFMAKGLAAQRKSVVLLKNGENDANQWLPVSTRPKLYIENVDPVVAGQYADLVETPEEADLAIIRIESPYEQREGPIASMLHAGDVDFKAPEKARILNLLETVPTVVNIYLDRGIVMPEISEASAALIADFGAEDAVILDLVFGQSEPTGKLPIEMPSSVEAVSNQFEDVPFDSADPLYPVGFGLTYEQATSETAIIETEQE